eukprot:977360-Amorphochlora_amoeboformis.AAC.1
MEIDGDRWRSQRLLEIADNPGDCWRSLIILEIAGDRLPCYLPCTTGTKHDPALPGTSRVVTGFRLLSEKATYPLCPNQVSHQADGIIQAAFNQDLTIGYSTLCYKDSLRTTIQPVHS